MKNSIKLIVIICTIWILIFGFFQLESGMLSINKSEINCPFSTHSEAMCQMNPMGHIQEWQSMFTMIPTQNILLLLFTLFILLVVSKLKFWNRFSTQEPPLLVLVSQFSLVNLKILDPLKIAFSRGILNPKTF